MPRKDPIVCFASIGIILGTFFYYFPSTVRHNFLLHISLYDISSIQCFFPPFFFSSFLSLLFSIIFLLTFLFSSLLPLLLSSLLPLSLRYISIIYTGSIKSGCSTKWFPTCCPSSILVWQVGLIESIIDLESGAAKKILRRCVETLHYQAEIDRYIDR